MSPRADPIPLTPKQQKLVLDCQGFVRKVERHYAYRYRLRLKVDDVRQIVRLALTEAARTFDPERGIDFPKYAWKHVDGALADATRHEWAARALYAAAMPACAELQIVENEIALEGDAASDVARHDHRRPEDPPPRRPGPFRDRLSRFLRHLPGKSSTSVLNCFHFEIVIRRFEVRRTPRVGAAVRNLETHPSATLARPVGGRPRGVLEANMQPNEDASAVAPRAYSASDIQVLTAVEAVRKRPGMYVGDTCDGSGLHHLATELVEVALMDHLEGRLFHIAVTLHRAGGLTVEDDGPGLPVDGPYGPASAFELFFTEFGQCWQARHPFGLGHTVVNALSERLFVEVHRAGAIHSQEFRAGRPIARARRDGASDRTGTRITLRPDPDIFSSVAFDGERALVRLREIAFLHPALRINFVDERKGRRESLHGQSISTWMERLTEGQLARPERPLRVKGVREGIYVDVALRWTSASSAPRVRGFVNAFPVRSGSHLKGLWAGLQGGLSTLSEARSVRAGLVAIVDLRGPGLHRELSGCCRDELESNAVARAVSTVVNSGLTRELAASPGMGDTLLAPDRFGSEVRR